MADVSGTINVEVIYKDAGGSGGFTPSDITGGSSGGASGGGAAADKKKTTGLLSEMAKFAKVTAASLTVGAAIKNSKIMSGFLGTMSQLLGALIDVFLMPFIPLLIPVMKVMAGLIKWLVKFMEDPIGTIKEVWGNIAEFVKNDLTKFGKEFFTLTFWQEIWGKIDWEQILKMGVGGAGLVGLIAALSTGMSLAMAAPGFITKLVTGLIPGMGGKGSVLSPACCAGGVPGKVPAVLKGGLPLVPIAVTVVSLAPPVTAALLLAGAILGGDGLPGELGDVLKTFNQHLESLNESQRNILIDERMSMSLKDQHDWMKNILENLGPTEVPTSNPSLPTPDVYSLTGQDLTPPSRNLSEENVYESLVAGARLFGAEAAARAGRESPLNAYDLLRTGSALPGIEQFNPNVPTDTKITIDIHPTTGVEWPDNYGLHSENDKYMGTGIWDPTIPARPGDGFGLTYRATVQATRDNQRWVLEG